MPTEVPPAPPAQAAPAADSPAVAPPAPAERQPSEFMADVIGDFETMDSGKPAPERDTKGKFTKRPEQPPEKSEQSPPDKPVEEPQKPAEEKPPTRMRELGERYDTLKKRVSTELEPKIQSLEARIKEYESKKPEDVTPLQNRIKQLEQQNSELDQRLSFMDYQQGNEYRAKYEQPYQEAWNDAIAEFSELRVREPDGADEMGEPKFKFRQASDRDLLRLANMSLSDMDEAANAMFGASAARAINHVQNIKRLSSAKFKALDEAKKKSLEWRQSQHAEFQTRAKALADTWQDVNNGLKERFPKAFSVDETRPEDKPAHTKGFALADLLFLGPQALTPEQLDTLPSSFKETLKSRKPLTETQKVQLHALGRLKMANHDRLVSTVKGLRSRVAELEKSLSEYEKSEPSAGRAGKREPTKKSDSDFLTLDSIASDFQAMDK